MNLPAKIPPVLLPVVELPSITMEGRKLVHSRSRAFALALLLCAALQSLQSQSHSPQQDTQPAQPAPTQTAPAQTAPGPAQTPAAAPNPVPTQSTPQPIAARPAPSADHTKTGEVTEDELKTAKDTAINSLVFAFDTRTKTLGRGVAADGAVLAEQRWPTVGPEEVAEVLARFITAAVPAALRPM